MNLSARDRTHFCWLTFLVALLATSAVSCAKKVNASDPEAVARAFVVAVANKNVETALQYVIPEQRDDARRWMEKEFPPFPKEPTLKVTVKGDRADVEIVNAQGLGFDMKRQDKKWWIVK